jgi:hypothetical protein
LSRRIDGLGWVVQSLAQAKLENVRESRFNDLLDVLFAALPDELEHHPIAPPTSRQKKMLRQAVFARTEDPKLGVIAKQGRLRTTFGQLQRNRRFKSGRGMSPHIGEGWSRVDLRAVATIEPAGDAHEVAAIDDLITRWLRASVLGSRTWGAGYYGWSMIGGLQAMMLNIACVGWLARLHAAGRMTSPSPSADNGQTNHNDRPRERAGVRVHDQRTADARTPSLPAPLPRNISEGEGRRLTIADIRAAIGRIDRTSGRAKWLGSSAERLRLGFLHMDDGLRRLIAQHSAVTIAR